MKRFIMLIALISCSLGIQAQELNLQQKQDSVFIEISFSAFSNCFANIDRNKDRLVTYAEALVADTLYLGYGGRKNLISNLDFLKHFPNLKYLNIGNYTGEHVDVRNLKKLEELDLGLAPFVKKIIISTSCQPRIRFPHGEREFTVSRVRDPNDQAFWWN